MTGFRCKTGKFVFWFFSISIPPIFKTLFYLQLFFHSPHLMGRGSKHLLAQSKPALLLPSQLATVPCRVCTPSSPEIKCIKQCEDGLCQARIHCLAFCNSTAVESGYKTPSLLKNSSTFLKGVGRVNHSVEVQGIQH